MSVTSATNNSEAVRRLRRTAAESALQIARDLEAGRAVAPFQERLTQLAGTPTPPVRAAVIATSADTLHALLSEIIGQDYNVCKVVVPSRLGFSEVLLQERGFLLDAGAGPQEFDDAGSFLSALQKTHALQQDTNSDGGLEPLRVKLKGPAHLNGLCLLVPHSVDALVRKPALLSTLADQTDWVFLAGSPASRLNDEQRSAIQLVLDNVTGLQNVLQSTEPPAAGTPAENSEWWKGWRVTLSLGVVRLDTELLRSRLTLLTSPGSELRQYLVESRLLRQLEMTLALMEEETQQAQRQLGNRLSLSKEGLVGGAGPDTRKSAETLRTRIAEETESVIRSAEREAKASLAPDGEINRRLRDCASQITPDDIEQTAAEATIKLTVASHVNERLVATVSEIGRTRLESDFRQIREGLECSVRDAERALEKATGARHKLPYELPDESTLWDSIAGIARPEMRYRGEMPRPTIGSRLQTARQSIMSLMIAATVLGGVATLAGDGAGGGMGIRNILYALMLPLLVIGFLWTYVSFRKKERITLEKEVEKLQDGVFNELRRAVQDLHREQQSIVNSAVQKVVRSLQQQIDTAFETVEKQRQREADDQRRRSSDQQRSVEQRISRLRQFGTQINSLQSRLGDARKQLKQWLGDWIDRFNQGKV